MVLSNQSCSGVWGKLLNLAAITGRSGSTRAQCCITSRDFCFWSDSWWDCLLRGRSQTSVHSINMKGGHLNGIIDSVFSMRPLCFSDPEWGLFIRTNAMCPSWVNEWNSWRELHTWGTLSSLKKQMFQEKIIGVQLQITPGQQES